MSAFPRVDVLPQRWFVTENDVIGGWSVMNADVSPSQADGAAGQREVASFMAREAAEHVAGLHNAWLGAHRRRETFLNGGDVAGAVAVEAALVTLGSPGCPRDGDCQVWAPLVTFALTSAGLSAQPAVVHGWVNQAERVLGFLHQVSVCDGLVVDFTAQQFNPELPARWIVPEADYCRVLAQAAAVESVSIVISGSEQVTRWTP